KRLHAGAKLNLAATGAEVVPGSAVEVGERHGRNSHAPGSGRFKKRLAHHLRSIGDRNLVEVFVQGADQDCLPEAFDGWPGLSVAFEPVEECLTPILRS